MDDSMKHKVICRTKRKDFKSTNGSKGKTQELIQKKKIPPGAWMSVYFECCVLTGRGLCDGLVIRPEEF
jgi:hypothetical protein